MFHTAYQSGTHLEIFDSKTNYQKEQANNLFRVSSVANWTKQYDKILKSYIYQLDGHNTKLRFPKDEQQELSLMHQYLVLQIFIPVGMQWSLEISLTDTSKTKRRINFAYGMNQIERKFFHVKVPIQIVKHGVWLNLSIDTWSFMDAWKGQTIRSVDAIIIGSFAKIRRIFTMKNVINQTALGQFQGEESIDQKYSSLSDIPQGLNYGVGIPCCSQVLTFNKLMAYCGETSSPYQDSAIYLTENPLNQIKGLITKTQPENNSLLFNNTNNLHLSQFPSNNQNNNIHIINQSNSQQRDLSSPMYDISKQSPRDSRKQPSISIDKSKEQLLRGNAKSPVPQNSLLQSPFKINFNSPYNYDIEEDMKSGNETEELQSHQLTSEKISSQGNSLNKNKLNQGKLNRNNAHMPNHQQQALTSNSENSKNLNEIIDNSSQAQLQISMMQNNPKGQKSHNNLDSRSPNSNTPGKYNNDQLQLSNDFSGYGGNTSTSINSGYSRANSRIGKQNSPPSRISAAQESLTQNNIQSMRSPAQKESSQQSSQDASLSVWSSKKNQEQHNFQIQEEDQTQEDDEDVFGQDEIEEQESPGDSEPDTKQGDAQSNPNLINKKSANIPYLQNGVQQQIIQSAQKQANQNNNNNINSNEKAKENQVKNLLNGPYNQNPNQNNNIKGLGPAKGINKLNNISNVSNKNDNAVLKQQGTTQIIVPNQMKESFLKTGQLPSENDYFELSQKFSTINDPRVFEVYRDKTNNINNNNNNAQFGNNNNNKHHHHHQNNNHNEVRNSKNFPPSNKGEYMKNSSQKYDQQIEQDIQVHSETSNLNPSSREDGREFRTQRGGEMMIRHQGGLQNKNNSSDKLENQSYGLNTDQLSEQNQTQTSGVSSIKNQFSQKDINIIQNYLQTTDAYGNQQPPGTAEDQMSSPLKQTNLDFYMKTVYDKEDNMIEESQDNVHDLKQRQSFYEQHLTQFIKGNMRPYTPPFQTAQMLLQNNSVIKQNSMSDSNHSKQKNSMTNSGLNNGPNFQQGMLEVVYDPVLQCYYDPVTNSYYQLKE